MFQVTYEKIIKDKFHFTELCLSKDFQKLIWDLKCPDTGKKDGEVRYKIKQVKDEIKEQIINSIYTLELEDILKGFIDTFDFEINRMTKGEWIPFHNEEAQLSPFEVILWLTRTDNYEGREFVMVDNGTETSIKPKNGTICFLDTTAPDVYHGVSPLLSDTEIISIVGGLGRKNAWRN